MALKESSRRPSKAGEQSRQREIESDCDEFQVDQRHISMTALYVGQVTAVQSKSFRQLDLRPTALLPQAPKSLPESNPDVLGHQGDIMACYV